LDRRHQPECTGHHSDGNMGHALVITQSVGLGEWKKRGMVSGASVWPMNVTGRNVEGTLRRWHPCRGHNPRGGADDELHDAEDVIEHGGKNAGVKIIVGSTWKAKEKPRREGSVLSAGRDAAKTKEGLRRRS